MLKILRNVRLFGGASAFIERSNKTGWNEMFKGMEDYSNIWLYYGLNSNFNKPNDYNNEQFHTSCADLVNILSTFTDEQGNGINFQ